MIKICENLNKNNFLAIVKMIKICENLNKNNFLAIVKMMKIYNKQSKDLLNEWAPFNVIKMPMLSFCCCDRIEKIDTSSKNSHYISVVGSGKCG